jgi:iron(III) transport system substrate-binding protein
VLVVNTKLVADAERPASVLDLTAPRWRGRVVMAKPLHGTALTQAVSLFEVVGPEKARAYYRDLKANGLQEAPGNKQVAEWVGAGRTPRGDAAAVGVTDTDDALAEVAAGRPVAVVFPDADKAKGQMGTLFIPNTLCVLAGSPNSAGARRLVDYLLSAEVEGRLAEAASHQVPVNPAVKASLPPQMKTPQTAAAMKVDWDKAVGRWDEAWQFLRREFATP